MNNMEDVENRKNIIRRTHILIDWLFEVAEEYSLLEDTIDLTMQYLYKIYSIEIPSRETLQLTGTTCLYIACKIEEVLFPTAKDLVCISDKAFTEKDIFLEECRIIKLLDFDLILEKNKVYEIYVDQPILLYPPYDDKSSDKYR